MVGFPSGIRSRSQPRRLARRHGRPCLVVDLASDPTTDAAIEWLTHHDIRTLNVAGSRESQSPGIHEMARGFLQSLFELCG